MKKILLALLIIALALGLAACGEKEVEPKETYIISARMVLPGDISEISRCILRGDKLLLCCKEEREGEKARYYAAEMSLDGNQFSRISLELESKERLVDLALDTQGKIWGLIETPKSARKSKYTLWHFDFRNRKNKRIELNELLEREGALHAGADMWLLSDPAGKLCLTVGYEGTYCFFFDELGDYLFSLTNEGRAEAAVKTGSGQFAVCSSEGTGKFFNTVDIQKQAWGTKTEMGTNANVFSAESAVCYIYDSANFYEWSESAKKTLLFDWAEAGLSSGDSHVCALGDGRFAVISSGFSQTGIGEYEYCLVEPGKDRRTVLEMVSLRPDISTLDAVARFNRSCSEYRVELRSFFAIGEEISSGAWDSAVTKLERELSSGKIPDIIDLNSMPVQTYMRQGLLEDLYPYIQNDPLISEEDFFENAFAAMSVDGKLPYVTSNVAVLTVFADSRIVGEERGWTLDEFAALASNSNCFLAGLSSVVDVAHCNSQLGWRAKAIGYPGGDAPIHVIQPANCIGISSASECKEAAWEFVRSFLEAEQQEGGDGFPIRTASFEKLSQAAADGRSVWLRKYSGKVYEEDIALATQILNSAAYCINSSDDLTETILSSAQACFGGADSPEQAAAR